VAMTRKVRPVVSDTRTKTITRGEALMLTRMPCWQVLIIVVLYVRVSLNRDCLVDGVSFMRFSYAGSRYVRGFNHVVEAPAFLTSRSSSSTSLNNEAIIL
jgi:hypothetical protein